MDYEESDAPYVYFGNMYYLIKSDSPENFLSDLRCVYPNQYRSVFESYGLRWNHLIETDVNLILSGYEPRYFLHEDTWVDKFRRKYGIYAVYPEGGIKSMYELLAEAEVWLDDREKEHEKWGISLWMKDAGYACYNEMHFFYDTDEWKDRAAAARYEWDYTCDTCRVKGHALHVHHSAPIFTAYDFKAYRNFSGLRLSLYCQKCHEWWHVNSVRGYGYYGYQRASVEEVAEEKEYFCKWRHAHDEMKDCQFCQRFGYFNK